MANAFYGRLAAYKGAADEGALAMALARNLWRGAEADGRALALAFYVRTARQALELSMIEQGKLDFGGLPSL